MKEMVGGCCVCSDERGWPENPLVYCDGQNCTVAVHQACYGIVTVPTGPWFCRKCESQERSARVRCELCPSRDGALKKTDNQGWAHVVCALYIPEVRFGNVTTMEPIILQLIPQERYAKTCYICQEIGKGSRATVGACMQCNKSGCKMQFHVTCAQGLGLLCEEAGNYLDNVKYCGYCQHHYSKLKKGGNVKTIPPYKPVTHESGSSDGISSPEKELEPVATTSSQSTTINSKNSSNQGSTFASLNSSSSSSSSSKQRKSGSMKQSSSSSSSNSANANANTSGSSNSAAAASSSSTSSSKTSSSSSKDKDKHSKSLNKISSSSKGQDKEFSSSSSSTSTRDKSKSSKSSSKDMSSSSGVGSSDHANSSNSTISSANTSSSSATIATGTVASQSKDPIGQKFISSHSTESVFASSDTGFNSNDKNSTTPSTPANNNSTSSSSSSNRDNKSTSSSTGSGSSSTSAGKKRKADSSKSSTSSSSQSQLIDPLDISNPPLALRDIIKDVSVTLIPLPMEKTQDVGLEAIEKLSKKPKTDVTTSSPHHAIHESNTGQNLMGAQGTASISAKQHHHHHHHQQQQQQQAISQTGSSTNVSSSSNLSSSSHSTSAQAHIKPPILKDISVTDIRNRSDSPYSSSSGTAVGGLNSSSSTGDRTPSLYVSVPLSTANVPGINLPTSAATDHVTQSSRNSPLVNHHSSIIERQSPRILQNQRDLQHGDHSTAIHPTVGSLHQSNMSPTISQRSSEPLDTGLKITYEKQNIRVAQLQEEQLPARRSRTPDSVNLSSLSSCVMNMTPTATITATPASNKDSSSSSGGLKFTYEQQIGLTSIGGQMHTSISPLATDGIIKDSPPSSPGSEAGSARKRGRKSAGGETKDSMKMSFQNGGFAAHMLGNQLNPTSGVAQKLSEHLHMEIEAHSIYTHSDVVGPQLVGVPLPGKGNMARNSLSQSIGGGNSLVSSLAGATTNSVTGNTPQSLEQLLERQWEQGSQFLMEQAQHFDIASLLSCLHQLRTENVRLEEHVSNLIARRDHLLAVNARLAIPLNPAVPQNATLNNMHMNGPTNESVSSRLARSNAHYPTAVAGAQQSMPVENGIDFRHSSHPAASANPSSTISHN